MFDVPTQAVTVRRVHDAERHSVRRLSHHRMHLEADEQLRQRVPSGAVGDLALRRQRLVGRRPAVTGQHAAKDAVAVDRRVFSGQTVLQPSDCTHREIPRRSTVTACDADADASSRASRPDCAARQSSKRWCRAVAASRLSFA